MFTDKQRGRAGSFLVQAPTLRVEAGAEGGGGRGMWRAVHIRTWSYSFLFGLCTQSSTKSEFRGSWWLHISPAFLLLTRWPEAHILETLRKEAVR